MKLKYWISDGGEGEFSKVMSSTRLKRAESNGSMEEYNACYITYGVDARKTMGDTDVHAGQFMSGKDYRK